MDQSWWNQSQVVDWVFRTPYLSQESPTSSPTFVYHVDSPKTAPSSLRLVRNVANWALEEAPKSSNQLPLIRYTTKTECYHFLHTIVFQSNSIISIHYYRKIAAYGCFTGSIECTAHQEPREWQLSCRCWVRNKAKQNHELQLLPKVASGSDRSTSPAVGHAIERH